MILGKSKLSNFRIDGDTFMMHNTTQFKPEEEELYKATRYVNYIERQANKNDLLEKIEKEANGELLYGDKDSEINISSNAD